MFTYNLNVNLCFLTLCGFLLMVLNKVQGMEMPLKCVFPADNFALCMSAAWFFNDILGGEPLLEMRHRYERKVL